MPPTDRRDFLKLTAAAALPLAGVALAACGDDDSPPQAPQSNQVTDADESPTTAATRAQSTANAAPATAASSATLAPTPACTDDDDETLATTEGPYFTPNSPERASLLETGMKGTVLRLSGTVVDTNCRPVTKALLDVWQCDDGGIYDNAGYTLRGHVFSDADGRWAMETIVPGIYPGRTRHIHIKVQAPGGPVLTTQLFFPGDSGNSRDGIYRKELELRMGSAGAARTGEYQFVLRA